MDFQLIPGEPWRLRAGSQCIEIEPVEPVAVENVRLENFPDYQPDLWGPWQRGLLLPGLQAEECSAPDALDPDSLRLTSESGEAYEFGRDYQGDMRWGAFARNPEGRIPPGGTVVAGYRYYPQRIDSVIRAVDGSILIRTGEAHIAAPRIPETLAGETRLCNIHLPGKTEKLTCDMLFPILEEHYPAEPPPPVEHMIPRTLAKLRSGEPLRILAWGDSVTASIYLPRQEKWQEMFVRNLKARFPRARIELDTVAWGGHNTRQFLDEPPGSIHNYEEKVLGSGADLVVSEFVNDAGLGEEEFQEQYDRFLSDFRQRGMEWIPLTPHYIRPDWMNLTGQRDIDADPRPYVEFLRNFCRKNHLPCADGSRRYGRLWRQGIPYNTLMVNCINHPDERGMTIFADALDALFTGVDNQ